MGKFKLPLLAGLIVAGLAAGLWVGARSGQGAGAGTLGPSFGISLQLPSAWSGVIYDMDRGTPPTFAVLQAVSSHPADQLNGEDDLAVPTAEAMRPDDVLIILWETRGRGDEYPPLTGPPRVTADELTPMEGIAADRALARTLFSTQGRFFDLMVEFGRASPDPGQFDRANAVLRTLHVEPRSD